MSGPMKRLQPPAAPGLAAAAEEYPDRGLFGMASGSAGSQEMHLRMQILMSRTHLLAPCLVVLALLQTVSALRIVVCLTSSAELPRPDLCFMEQYGR